MQTPLQQRIGFHYFPDHDHFRERDLHTWLPRLRKLGTRWLTISAPEKIAVPEPFIRGVIEAGIEPILHIKLPVSPEVNPSQIQLIVDSYAKWGVRYLALFDRPNVRQTWQSASWVQFDLVERFLDQYLPFAELILASGMKPVFPPLHPGGDYWDTAFLRSALASILRRGKQELLDHLILSAYAWLHERPLNWGAGGPERWPGARPYYTPQGQQDQRGLYIFDWYLTLCQAVLGETRPIILFDVGRRPPAASPPGNFPRPSRDIQKMLAAYQLLSGTSPEIVTDSEFLEPVPEQVIAGNLWLLSASENSPSRSDSWFHPSGNELPVTLAVRRWLDERVDSSQNLETNDIPHINGHPISHYLLLPRYEWGIAEWHLDVVRPFVMKYQPTVGYSLTEATLAARVTVIGDQQTFPESELDTLRRSGTEVVRISGDGTSIATHLSRI